MAITKAATSYKKQEGSLRFDDTKQSVTWSPLASAKSSLLSIAIADITNLQQTPASSAKCALRIIVQPSTAVSAENHVFNFTSATAARSEQESLTDALRNAITVMKTGTSTPAQGPGSSVPQNDGPSAAMAIAQAVNSGARAAESWYDDQRLKSNHELQQSLLMKDPALRQRFEESLRGKPESISNSQFSTQFWSARIHLLRAHAIEKSQSQGAYNVLAEVKPRIVDGATKLNLSKEQIQLIFNQHPIVKYVYNEVVPKLSEMEFWARFFVSRLFKKLKGERLTDNDSRDAVLDKYLDTDEEILRNKPVLESHVPHFMDLEGNEQNHSQKQGNRPDFDMRPNASEKVPILRVLNNMSEKMLARVAPADGAMHAPVGMDEETFNQLMLRDLQADSEEDRVILNIKDQCRLFAGDSERNTSKEAGTYAKQDPAKVLTALNRDIDQNFTLENASVEDDADVHAATSQILFLISQQRNMLSASSSSTELPLTIMQSLVLTHNTTTEFLHYFWTLLLSPTSASARKDLPSLLTTLTNSLARIAAVAADAERERQSKLAEAKRSAVEYYQRTGKRRRVEEPAGGGKKEVDALMGPTTRAIAVAKARYEALNRA